MKGKSNCAKNDKIYLINNTYLPPKTNDIKKFIVRIEIIQTLSFSYYTICRADIITTIAYDNVKELFFMSMKDI